MKVAVRKGGRSLEREVSLRSGLNAEAGTQGHLALQGAPALQDRDLHDPPRARWSSVISVTVSYTHLTLPTKA